MTTMISSFFVHRQQRWKSYDLDASTINTSNLFLQCPLDNGRLPLDSLPPRKSTNTGPLLSLPPEILNLILNHLDIYTLTTFRRLSTQARSVISSHSLYASIYAHTPSTISAILSTGISSHIMLPDLHNSLASPYCSTCSSFGEFFNLLTGTRTCHFCWATTPQTILPSYSTSPTLNLLPMPISTAKSTYGLSPTTIRAMPKVRTLPGIYGREKTVVKNRTYLCLPATARAWGIAQHGNLAKMNSFLASEREKYEERMRKKWEKSDYSNGGRIMGSSIPDLKGLDRSWDNPHRHMVVVRFPWLNREGTGRLEWGIPCGQCREESKIAEDGEKKWNVMYSEEGLVEHLKWRHRL